MPGGTHKINETITETAERELFEELPENLTYPSIHNVLFDKAVEFSGHIKIS